MTITDFIGTHTAQRKEDIRKILSARRSGYNAFWITNDDTPCPYISILVKDNLAYVHYFPDEQQPGFHSYNDTGDLALTAFRIETPEQEQYIQNNAIVSFENAIRVAEDFFQTGAKSDAIKWQEL